MRGIVCTGMGGAQSNRLTGCIHEEHQPPVGLFVTGYQEKPEFQAFDLWVIINLAPPVILKPSVSSQGQCT